MTTPTTAAGRALLDDYQWNGKRWTLNESHGGLRARILAIEAEAREQVLRELPVDIANDIRALLDKGD